MQNFYLIISGYLLCLFSLLVGYYFYKIKNRKQRKIEPIRNSLFKSPTFRFQKYHPNFCPHDRGIYRKVKVNVEDKIIEKRIFVCADCLSVLEEEEIQKSPK